MLRTRIFTVILVAVAITIVAVGVNSNFVFADPCVASLSYPIMSLGYSYSNVPLAVPVSATCTTYYNQLDAAGSAYDETSNIALGSVNAALQPVNEGTVFSGQLWFNLPLTTQGDLVQVSVTIYSDQYGSPITATGETFQVGSGGQQQIYTTTVTQAYAYPYQYPSPYQSQYPYPYPYPYPNMPPLNESSFPYHHHHHPWQSQTEGIDNGLLFDYVAVAAILGAVIITTAALLTFGRRRPNWIPFQPPPHQQS